MGAHRLDLATFLMPFGHPFFIIFRDPPNLLNCNKHGVKTLLLPLLASHFGIENPLKIHVFSRHALGPNFSSFYMNLYQKPRLLDPLQNPMGCKMAPRITQVTPKPVPQIEAGDHCWRSWKRLVPQGPQIIPNRPRVLILNVI